MDGLLLNTEAFYTVVQQQIAKQYGKEFSWELKAKMMGLKAVDAAQTLVDELGLQGQLTAQQFLDERDERLAAMFPMAELMPGVERLLSHLHAHNVPCCVATSSTRAGYELKSVQHKDTFARFHHIVTGDQVTKGKPDPEIFVKAASRFDPPARAHSCLVFEDAPAGIAAAKSACMCAVMVPDAELDQSLCAQADEVLVTLEDFNPAAWGLPAFK